MRISHSPLLSGCQGLFHAELMGPVLEGMLWLEFVLLHLAGPSAMFSPLSVLGRLGAVEIGGPAEHCAQCLLPTRPVPGPGQRVC